MSRLRASVKRLQDFPELGARVEDFAAHGVREILHGSYRILYRYRGNAIDILAVRHGSKPLRPEDIG